MSGDRRFLPHLFIGDTVALLAFATLGRAEHNTGLALSGIVTTALPFIVAWYGVGLWLGAFREASVSSGAGRALRAVMLPWLLAWPLGLQLRALWLDRPIPTSFAIVVLITAFIMLAGWRTMYALFRRRRNDSAS